ncbi:MAG: hypothetical protein EOP84_05405 [Verrucomicrobiaceae bacterium]|nr:MAG: hypothetical protein EOP84_05405 [Verrucomicrobiaceae bacterium]
MNASVQEKWETLRDSLRQELSEADEVVARIPGWPPSSIEQALRWVQASVYEGFYVAFRVERSAASVTVWLKKWESGEDEPEWQQIYAR